MELDDYLRASFRHVRIILVATLVGLLAAYGSVRLTPVRYDASVAVTVLRVNASSTADYQYDGYYALQSTDFVVQTIVGWFGTPSFVESVYRTAGYDPALRSVDEAARRFHPKKTSVQSLIIEFSDESRDVAGRLADSAVKELAGRVPTLITTEAGKPSFDIRADAPVILERKPNPGLTIAIGALAGLLVGLFVAAAVEGVHRRGA
jgi:capsular polysaccharide biosynthesis protein